VVGEGVGESEGFEGALLEVKVTDRSYSGAEFAEGDREACVRFLRSELGESEAEGGFGETECCLCFFCQDSSVVMLSNFFRGGECLPRRALTTLSTFCSASMVPR